jgi:hypothetical protein
MVGAMALVVGGCQLVSGLGDLHVVATGMDAGTKLCEPGATEPCYSGDPATRGVGPCHDGTATCNAAGDAFGKCTGDALPVNEDNCAGTVDLDCDGKPPTCHGDPVWVRGFGGAGDDRGLGIGRGKGFAPMFAGSFSGSVDFGTGPLVSAGGTDVVASTVDGAGTPKNPRRFGGGDDDAAAAIWGDEIDEVILAGRYRGTIDFGDGKPLVNAGDTDGFVTLADTGGKALWSVGLGDDAEQEVAAAVSDVALDVIVAGTFAGSITTSAGAVTTPGSIDHDAFVLKLGPTGQPLWIHQFADGLFGEQRALGVATDRSKAVIVAGTAQGDVDFGGGAQPSGGGHDAFVAKLVSDGSFAWGHLYGDMGDAQAVNAVATASNDDILIAGGFDGTITFEQPLMAAAPGRAIFVARLDGAGNPLWSRRFGDAAGDQAAYAVAVDQFDNVYVGGSFDGVIDLGATKLTSNGGGDAFVIKLDPKGNPLWGRRAGDAGAQRVNGIVVDNFGASTAVGSFEGTLDFGTPVVSAGGSDIFLARFSP